ncbi:MAG TPA: class I SAM-dependent methyltransferase [Saprospiraceae bacterium]|nr:class I SAM-dependent methyltransferase [Saprospiraceae bacterium]
MITSKLMLPSLHNKKILEICSGKSIFLDYVLKNMPNTRLLSINISEELNHKLRRQYGIMDNVRLRYGKTEELDYVEQFDVVVSVNSMQFSKNKDLAMEKLKQSLKPNGTFLLYAPIKEPSPLSAVLQHPKWSEYLKENELTYLSYLEYRKLVGKYFENTIDKHFHHQSKFKDSNTLFEYIFQWLPSYIPYELSEEFKRDFTLEYLNLKPPMADGSVVYDIQMIESLSVKKYD